MKMFFGFAKWLILGMLFGDRKKQTPEKFNYVEPTTEERAEMREHSENVILRQLGLKQ